MTVEKGLYIKSVFLILNGFTIINFGASQERDYTANVEVEELTVPMKNEYFSTKGEFPDTVFFFTETEFDYTKGIYLVDYYFDESGEKQNISSRAICPELSDRSNPELRNQVLSTFLFPNQIRCPAKMDRVRVPPSKMLSFNYNDSDISCDSWKYRQELFSLYQPDSPLAQLTVNLKMEKQNKCAS